MPNNLFVMKYEMKQTGTETADIMVSGYIVSEKWYEDEDAVTAKEFDRMLKDAKANGVKKLNVHVNSGGGEVFQAVAMRTMLMNCDIEKEIFIEGLAASAATLFSCIPGVKVTISEGSEYMIHNPSAFAKGNASALRKAAEHLEKMENDFRDIYAGKCGKTADEVKELMDAETWFTAKEAVEAGFCDEVASAMPAAACADEGAVALMRAMYRNVPEAVKAEKPCGSNEPLAAAAEGSTVNKDSKKEEETMEIKDLTAEVLREQNPQLYASVLAEGAQNERTRQEEIDDLTMPGYEAMAREAKANGTSSTDFFKAVVKAQKEKGEKFVNDRKTETAPAAQVEGGAAEDNTADMQKKLDDTAREIASYVTAAADAIGGMN